MSTRRPSKFANVRGLFDMQMLYRSLPSPLQRMVDPVKAFVKLLRAMRVSVWIVRGHELRSQIPLTLVYFGNTVETRKYWSRLVFGPSFEEVNSRALWLWQAAHRLRKGGFKYDLALMETPYSLRALVGEGGVFVANWVSGWVNIAPEDMAALFKNSSLRSDLRVIKRSGLSYEVTKDPRAFDDFYYHMYVPHISKTHGDTAVVMRYGPKRKDFEKCELLVVRRGGESISGVLLVYSDDGPRLWSLGIRDGDGGLMRDGGTAALFYFGCQYLSEKGFKKVHMGFSRPFMRDGVLRFKKKWGIRLTDSDPVGVVLQANFTSAGVRAFLLNNPFIYVEHGSLKGAVFLEKLPESKNESLTSLLKDYEFAGLTGMAIGDFDAWEHSRSVDFPKDFGGRIEQFNFASLFCDVKNA